MVAIPAVRKMAKMSLSSHLTQKVWLHTTDTDTWTHKQYVHNFSCSVVVYKILATFGPNFSCEAKEIKAINL